MLLPSWLLFLVPFLFLLENAAAFPPALHPTQPQNALVLAGSIGIAGIIGWRFLPNHRALEEPEIVPIIQTYKDQLLATTPPPTPTTTPPPTRVPGIFQTIFETDVSDVTTLSPGSLPMTRFFGVTAWSNGSIINVEQFVGFRVMDLRGEHPNSTWPEENETSLAVESELDNTAPGSNVSLGMNIPEPDSPALSATSSTWNLASVFMNAYQDSKFKPFVEFARKRFFAFRDFLDKALGPVWRSLPTNRALFSFILISVPLLSKMWQLLGRTHRSLARRYAPVIGRYLIEQQFDILARWLAWFMGVEELSEKAIEAAPEAAPARGYVDQGTQTVVQLNPTPVTEVAAISNETVQVVENEFATQTIETPTPVTETACFQTQTNDNGDHGDVDQFVDAVEPVYITADGLLPATCYPIDPPMTPIATGFQFCLEALARPQEAAPETARDPSQANPIFIESRDPPYFGTGASQAGEQAAPSSSTSSRSAGIRPKLHLNKDRKQVTQRTRQQVMMQTHDEDDEFVLPMTTSPTKARLQVPGANITPRDAPNASAAEADRQITPETSSSEKPSDGSAPALAPTPEVTVPSTNVQSPEVLTHNDIKSPHRVEEQEDAGVGASTSLNGPRDVFDDADMEEARFRSMRDAFGGAEPEQQVAEIQASWATLLTETELQDTEDLFEGDVDEDERPQPSTPQTGHTFEDIDSVDAEPVIEFGSDGSSGKGKRKAMQLSTQPQPEQAAELVAQPTVADEYQLPRVPGLFIDGDDFNVLLAVKQSFEPQSGHVSPPPVEQEQAATDAPESSSTEVESKRDSSETVTPSTDPYVSFTFNEIDEDQEDKAKDENEKTSEKPEDNLPPFPTAKDDNGDDEDGPKRPPSSGAILQAASPEKKSEESKNSALHNGDNDDAGTTDYPNLFSSLANPSTPTPISKGRARNHFSGSGAGTRRHGGLRTYARNVAGTPTRPAGRHGVKIATEIDGSVVEDIHHFHREDPPAQIQQSSEMNVDGQGQQATSTPAPTQFPTEKASSIVSESSIEKQQVEVVALEPAAEYQAQVEEQHQQAWDRLAAIGGKHQHNVVQPQQPIEQDTSAEHAAPRPSFSQQLAAMAAETQRRLEEQQCQRRQQQWEQQQAATQAASAQQTRVQDQPVVLQYQDFASMDDFMQSIAPSQAADQIAVEFEHDGPAQETQLVVQQEPSVDPMEYDPANPAAGMDFQQDGPAQHVQVPLAQPQMPLMPALPAMQQPQIVIPPGYAPATPAGMTPAERLQYELAELRNTRLVQSNSQPMHSQDMRSEAIASLQAFNSGAASAASQNTTVPSTAQPASQQSTFLQHQAPQLAQPSVGSGQEGNEAGSQEHKQRTEEENARWEERHGSEWAWVLKENRAQDYNVPPGKKGRDVLKPRTRQPRLPVAPPPKPTENPWVHLALPQTSSLSTNPFANSAQPQTSTGSSFPQVEIPAELSAALNKRHFQNSLVTKNQPVQESASSHKAQPSFQEQGNQAAQRSTQVSTPSQDISQEQGSADEHNLSDISDLNDAERAQVPTNLQGPDGFDSQDFDDGSSFEVNEVELLGPDANYDKMQREAKRNGEKEDGRKEDNVEEDCQMDRGGNDRNEEDDGSEANDGVTSTRYSGGSGQDESGNGETFTQYSGGSGPHENGDYEGNSGGYEHEDGHGEGQMGRPGEIAYDAGSDAKWDGLEPAELTDEEDGEEDDGDDDSDGANQKFPNEEDGFPSSRRLYHALDRLSNRVPTPRRIERPRRVFVYGQRTYDYDSVVDNPWWCDSPEGRAWLRTEWAVFRKEKGLELIRLCHQWVDEHKGYLEQQEEMRQHREEQY